MSEKLELDNPVKREDIVVYDDYVGPGYSQPTKTMVKAVKLLAREEGILMDPVYSGKTIDGMMDLIEKRKFKKSQNILFIHTGGSPALFAYQDVLLKDDE